MNLFEEAIRSGRVSTAAGLKALFRRLAKRTHPDSGGTADGSSFVALRREYETALARLEAREIAPRDTKPYDRNKCVGLFVDLLAGSFPIALGAKRPKAYSARLTALNAELSKLGSGYVDLFLGFESEMYALRGESVVLNHDYSVVMTYLYQFKDYTHSGSRNSLHYLEMGLAQVREILGANAMRRSLAFVAWLVGDLSEN